MRFPRPLGPGAQDERQGIPGAGTSGKSDIGPGRQVIRGPARRCDRLGGLSQPRPGLSRRPDIGPETSRIRPATFTVNAVQNRAANTSRRHIPAKPVRSPDTPSCDAGGTEPLGCYAGFTATAECAHCSARAHIRCRHSDCSQKGVLSESALTIRGASCFFGSGQPSRRSAPWPLLLSSLRSSPRLRHQRRPGAHPHPCSGKPLSARTRLSVERCW